MRVLLVEDSLRVAEAVTDTLRAAGYVVALASNRQDGLAEVDRGHVDLAIVDVGLPDGSGLDLCRAWRQARLNFPVLLLTAHSTVADRVAGLDAGADDYLCKPFAAAELLARVRALGRRGPHWTESKKVFADLAIDRDRRTVTRGGATLPLTPREFDVVAVLAWRDGRVVRREDLLEIVWGVSSEREGASLEVLVSRVRRKLGSRPGEGAIRTIRGVGYAWALEPSNRA